MNEYSQVSAETRTAPEARVDAVAPRLHFPASGADDEIDLLALVRTLWRGKWWIGFFSILGVVLAAYYLTEMAVPKYRATAVVALNDQQAQVVDIQSVVSGFGGDTSAVNTEAEVLKSRILAETVVERLGLMENPEFNPALESGEDGGFSLGRVIGFVKETVLGQVEEDEPMPVAVQKTLTIDNVLSAISVSNVRQSYVFRITAETEDPELSRDLANTTAEAYLQSQLEAKFEATERATQWLTERVAELQVELENSEQAVKDFSVQTDLISPTALQELEVQIKDIRDRIVDTRANISALETRLDGARAATDIAELRTATGESAAVLRATNADEFELRKSQSVRRLELNLQRSQSQLAALETSLANLEESTSQQAQDLVALRQLEREAQASRLIYEHFLSRLKETSVQQGVQEADARILSFASPPLAASSPRVAVTLALALLLGAFFGAALMLLREMTTSTFRFAEFVEEELGYPVIGQVPVMPYRRRKKVIKYLIEKPTSAVAEAIRNVRTTLLLKDVDNPPQVFVSTSSVASEGKTTLSVALAANFASMGRSVLLIEGDIRRRTFGEYFDIPHVQGLVSVLTNGVPLEEATYRDAKTNLDVLQGEQSSVNAADLYASQKFRTLVEMARAKYDYVIIDTPPALMVPDARIVARVADAVVFTVKWDDTPKSQVRRALRLFQSVGLKVDGIVLSQINPKRMRAYGYGDYGDSAYYES